MFIPVLILASVYYSVLSPYYTLTRGNPIQSPSYFVKALIGSCSGPWSNIAPITKDSLSSPLNECQKPEGKIAGEALLESSKSVLTFDFHKIQEEAYLCRLTWLEILVPVYYLFIFIIIVLVWSLSLVIKKERNKEKPETQHTFFIAVK